MEVRLNKESINIAIEKLNNLKEETTDVALSRIVDKLLTAGEQEANFYTRGAPQSGVEQSRIVKEKSSNGLSGFVALIGKNAVYDEFGTGTQGERDPHPMKNNFSLNPYNSGPHIFYNQLVDRYQWYYKPMSGEPYFTETGLTEGIPSGKMIYRASAYVRKIKDKVIKDELNATVRKFK